MDATSMPGKAFDLTFEMPEPDVGIMTFNRCVAVDQWEAMGRPDILEKNCHSTCPKSMIVTTKMYNPNMKVDILAIPPASTIRRRVLQVALQHARRERPRVRAGRAHHQALQGLTRMALGRLAVKRPRLRCPGAFCPCALCRRRPTGPTRFVAFGRAAEGGRRRVGSVRPSWRGRNLLADDRRSDRGHEGCRLPPVPDQGGDRPRGCDAELARVEAIIEAGESEPDKARGRRSGDGIVDLAVEGRRAEGSIVSDPVIVGYYADHKPFRQIMEHLSALCSAARSGPTHACPRRCSRRPSAERPCTRWSSTSTTRPCGRVSCDSPPASSIRRRPRHRSDVRRGARRPMTLRRPAGGGQVSVIRCR